MWRRGEILVVKGRWAHGANVMTAIPAEEKEFGRGYPSEC